MLSGYEENSSNVTYLYADRDKKTIYTNRKEYADFDNLDDSVKKIEMLDKYVLVGARASQFKGNVTGVLYSDCNYHNRLVTEPQDFVFVMGVDTKYPVQDAFYYESHSYSYYQSGIGVALAGAILSGILLMVCIIWLTIVVGRKPEDTELYLIGFDKLPTEVGAIIVVGLWGIFAAIMLNVANYLSSIVWSDEIYYLGWSPGASVPMLIGIGILGFGILCVFHVRIPESDSQDQSQKPMEEERSPVVGYSCICILLHDTGGRTTVPYHDAFIITQFYGRAEMEYFC